MPVPDGLKLQMKGLLLKPGSGRWGVDFGYVRLGCGRHRLFPTSCRVEAFFVHVSRTDTHELAFNVPHPR